MTFPHITLNLNKLKTLKHDMTNIIRSCTRGFAAFLLLTTLTTGRAQSAASDPASGDDIFSKWFAMVSHAQAEQPHWMTPLVTVTPRLEQEYRYDQSFESVPEGRTLDNYGGGKGLEIIPAENVEVILGVPAWESESKPAGKEGFADDSFLVKYRLLYANETNGNYILTAFLGATVPTGGEHFTTDRYTFTPTIAGGKGWGRFDVQSTLGISLPTDRGTDPSGPGTPLAWNTALQYKLGMSVWPEVEANYTYYPNGEHEGKEQLFVTPGLIFGRFPLWERLAMSVGLGYQVAVTSKPTYLNNFILTVRFPF
jgi:hypothetical protein